jgi:hypothetical protein
MFQILGTKVSRFKIVKVADLKFQSQSFRVSSFEVSDCKCQTLWFRVYVEIS